MSEEFFRLPSKGKTPLHEKLYTNAYGAYCLTRGFFVEFLYVFLFFLRYGKEKRCAQSHHFGINNFAHTLARQPFYLIFQRSGHTLPVYHKAYL